MFDLSVQDCSSCVVRLCMFVDVITCCSCVVQLCMCVTSVVSVVIRVLSVLVHILRRVKDCYSSFVLLAFVLHRL